MPVEKWNDELQFITLIIKRRYAGTEANSISQRENNFMEHWRNDGSDWMTVLWNATPCSLVDRCWHFEGKCSSNLQSSGFFRNVCIYVEQILPDWVGYWKWKVASPLHLLHPNHYEVLFPPHFEITGFHYSENVGITAKQDAEFTSLFSPYLFIYLWLI